MIELLTLTEKEKWSNYLLKLPVALQDIYYTPEYYEIYETNGYGQAICFVFILNQNVALYPFLLNSINDLGYKLPERYYDIQGAYGYNGILSTTYDEKFVTRFNEEFLRFVKQKKIVAEFTRFNPVLENHRKPFHFKPVFDQENIVLKLTSENISKSEYEYSTRKNIKKALRNNLQSIIIEGGIISEKYLNIFIEVYYQTMRRNNASIDYFFSKNYFTKLISSIKSNCKFYFAHYEDTIISVELVLFGKQIGYSFLGGTLEDFFHLRPNDFLKDVIIKDLKSDNKQYFCLGGGSPGIIRYKRSFAKNGIRKFYIGKNIYNSLVYDNVIKQWAEMHPESLSSNSNVLLKYRKV